ncbi:hypothetical protein DL93DRAFT_1706541 [Clavulina sp. PMI_390]|nr:hypothetical protein DL93DRAFT_1706541 [Clavulina sp. PMI_390]
MPATHFCNCCNTPKAFTTRYSLDRHSKKGTKPFVCEYPECGKRYAQKTLLCDHERKQHLGVKNVPCRYCTEKFWSRSEANRHESKEHQLSLFRCALSLGDNPTCRHKG